MAIKQIVRQNGKLFVWDERAITDKDYYKIMNLVSKDIGKTQVLPYSLHKLYLFATNSKKYESRKIPKNVVTLNSEVILVNNDHEKQFVKIVLPENINSKHDISVYSPLGLACIGAKENDFLYVPYQNSPQKLFVEKIIFQPEKAKAFYL